MSRPIALVAVLAAATAASGCAGFSRAIGASRSSPDEFRVMTHAPLTLPPDYNLRPPRPGEARPGENDPSTEARTALFGDNVGQGASQGERSFIAAAGASTADDNIRETIDFESQGVVRRNEGFVNRLLAFGGSGAPAAAPLNAEEEARRLADEESIRRATGGGQVIIRRERGGGFRLPGT
ncbi:MAG: hypothetical protein A4S17_07735 [Proteobacteria bacterium HN_bin10]|jgi:hypothetical protein|nr:MAG: hypothetical protein A4S17_07735 [Proteobacteria bacterium HN_bin10]